MSPVLCSSLCLILCSSEQSGVETARLLRGEGFRGLIIAVTGNALDDDVAAFLGAGADLVLAKPLRGRTVDALLRFVSEFGFQSDPASVLVARNDSFVRQGRQRGL